jgi:IS5 family transposase
LSQFLKELLLIETNPPPPKEAADSPTMPSFPLLSRIYLDRSYRMTIDLLNEMPQITGKIGLSAADLPSPFTPCKAFDRISMSVCRVLLRQSAQLHDPSKHGAIDATFYERSAASRHYCQRISYRVQKLRVTKLVDTGS